MLAGWGQKNCQLVAVFSPKSLRVPQEFGGDTLALIEASLGLAKQLHEAEKDLESKTVAGLRSVAKSRCIVLSKQVKRKLDIYATLVADICACLRLAKMIRYECYTPPIPCN